MLMFWVTLLAVSILLYVLLDGFDLGVGMLLGLTSSETRRRAMLDAVAPIWDGNETWLVVTAVILWGAFPVAYATLLSAFYLPVLVMLAGLILRGVFLLRRRELEWFYQDGANMIFPDAWERFTRPIPPAERGDMMAAYYRRLVDTNIVTRLEAARAWSQWEGDTLSVRGPEARPPKFEEDDFTVAFARIECHYFNNGGFFPEDGWLLKKADRFRNIPGWIVQGRFDVVTPMDAAWRLHKTWPEANFEVVWDAGHASTEPGIVDALVRATDQALKL